MYANTTSNQYSAPSSAMPGKNPVKAWDRASLKDWLESIKCGQYLKVFEQNHISGDILLECDEAALKEMGIRKVGDRLRLALALDSLRVKALDGEKSRRKTLQELDRESSVASPFQRGHRGSHYASHSHLTPQPQRSPEDSYFSRRVHGSLSSATTHSSTIRPEPPRQSSSAPRLQTVFSQKSNGSDPVKNIMSMDVVKQNTVKFIYGMGQSKTVNISGCYTAEQIKLRALRKISVTDVSPDSWTVHVADNELGATAHEVSDQELVDICHHQDRQERRRLMLCVNGTTPSLKQMYKSQQILRDSLSSHLSPYSATSAHAAGGPLKAHGDSASNMDDSDDDDDEAQTVFPDMPRGSSRQLDRLSGQRPPSELISSNLAHFFPEATPRALEKTVRNSIRFSRRMSRMSRTSRYSNRFSVASSLAWGGIPEYEEDIPPMPPLPTLPSASNLADNSPTLDTIQSAEAPTESKDSDTMTPSNKNRSSISSVKSKDGNDAISTLRSRFSFHDGKRVSRSESPRIESPPGELPSAKERPAASDSEDGDETEFMKELEGEESGPRKWIRGRLIGSGSFGTVYLGMNSFTGELMAVKQVELPSDDSETAQRKKHMVEALQREMDILRSLQHENIVQYLGTNSEGNYLNIFLEYVPGGSVATLLSSYGEFNESLIRNFVRQILRGLKYLHDQNIIHRDIKGANVLVDNKGCIKISDFGISKKIETRLLTSNRVSLQGSVYWMAPEVVKQTSYTVKADIWSLGCLIIEMFSGTHPFPEFSQMQAIFKLGNSGTPTIPPIATEEARDFLAQTFQVDHTKRPSADDLLKHPFMNHMIA
uniref:mitogen-activated protein kinase kinase kinase n=1 Tax=Blastobotrys adeninivorans TaxID=409370 RepID=A0A060T6Y2_BLAAD